MERLCIIINMVGLKIIRESLNLHNQPIKPNGGVNILLQFSGILSALIIIELAGVILAGIFSGKIQDFLTKESKPLFEQYNATFTPTGTANTYAYKSWDKTTSAMDSLQTRVSLSVLHTVHFWVSSHAGRGNGQAIVVVR